MKTHVQQIVNTVEVKTRKIIKNTMQGKKPDPDNRTKVNHVIKQTDTDAIVEDNHKVVEIQRQTRQYLRGRSTQGIESEACS